MKNLLLSLFMPHAMLWNYLTKNAKNYNKNISMLIDAVCIIVFILHFLLLTLLTIGGIVELVK